jgi:superfamily II RNA helicase
MRHKKIHLKRVYSSNQEQLSMTDKKLQSYQQNELEKSSRKNSVEMISNKKELRNRKIIDFINKHNWSYCSLKSTMNFDLQS